MLAVFPDVRWRTLANQFTNVHDGGQVMCHAALFADIYVTPVHTAVYRPEEAARLWAK